MRIAIVDDIKEERDKLADVLTKQLSRRGYPASSGSMPSTRR